MNRTTRLPHPDGEPEPGFRSLVTPVYRSSTTVFPDTASLTTDWWHESGYTYGLRGTPTTRDLAVRIAELERGWRGLVSAGLPLPS